VSAETAEPAWRDGKLEDLVRFQRGYDITKAEQRDGSVPVISSSGITSFHDEAMAHGPGVVIGRKGTLGSVHFAPGLYWPHDTTLWSRDLKGNDARFVFYFLHMIDFRRFDVGNSNPTLNRNHIHSLPIRIPSRWLQKRIANVLSRYDDLIENNRRRIALLEESACQIYREWFTRLRFPGHEHHPKSNGAPEGWHLTTLGQCVTLHYGKALKAESRTNGIYPVYGSSGIVGWHDKPLVSGPGIVLGRKGNVGSVFWSSVDFFPIDTVYYIEAATSDPFLYYTLKSMHFINTDVAVPGLNRNLAYSKNLVLPRHDIRQAFADFVSPLHEQIEKLRTTNAKLRTARDLLLPRLMSGEIAV
jgi:type I restriction enzyme, S subunit